MKKTICIVILVFIALFALVGCANKKSVKVEGTLEELMAKIYDSVNEKPKLLNTTLSAENIAYYLGTSDIDYTEGLASEPMIGSIPHSIVLLRVGENADVESIKTKIKDSVDPWKWVCVGVDDDQVIVDNIGDLVVLIMDKQDPESFHNGFLALNPQK